MRFRVPTRALARRPAPAPAPGDAAAGPNGDPPGDPNGGHRAGPDGARQPAADPEHPIGPDPDGAPGRDAAHGTPGLELTPVAPPVAPVVIPRWVQLVTLPLALLALWALARAAGTVTLVLIVACVIALIFATPVRILERRMPRGLAILVVYIGCFAIVAGIGVLLANPVSTQVTRFERNVPQIVSSANRELASLQKFLDGHGINLHIQQQGQTALQTLQKDLLKRSGDIVSLMMTLSLKRRNAASSSGISSRPV